MKHQMTGSQRMTALYAKRGMNTMTKTILPRNSMTLDRRGSTFSPMLCSAYRFASRTPSTA